MKQNKNDIRCTRCPNEAPKMWTPDDGRTILCDDCVDPQMRAAYEARLAELRRGRS